MKNEKIINALNKIEPDDEAKERMFGGMQKKAQPQRKFTKLRLKPVIITAIFLTLLVTTVVATTPMILRMIGSDIAFFESDQQTRYSADQELIKQISSEVGASIENNGFSLTVDNIAFDGTFMNIFFTMESEINLFEEAKNVSPKFIMTEAFIQNMVDIDIPGYMRLNDIFGIVKSDGYFVSDYEYKGVRRFVITDDLPNIFDINIYAGGRQELWHMTDEFEWPVPMKISLTIDMSESKVETLIVRPDLSASVTQPQVIRTGNDFFTADIEHNIIIDRVSISPLGNVLVITENIGNNPVDSILFHKYFILDDKGNHYGSLENHFFNERTWYNEKSKTSMFEFYGNVPADVQYLKLMPYNETEDYSYFDIEIASLPQRLVQNQHGSILIESAVITDESITLAYKYEGMVTHPTFGLADGNGEHIYNYSWTAPIYDRNTDSYTLVYTFENPPENLEDIIKSIVEYCMGIELLEEQAVIIPLR